MTIEYTPDGTPYLSDQSYLSETPPYTQELAQIIDAGIGGGGSCTVKDSKFNDLQPADPISPFPIGMLAPFMGENAPDGWLLCDGRTYDAAYFYALAEANPDFHGDGVFRVPDLRGRAPFGIAHDAPTTNADIAAPFTLGRRYGDARAPLHSHTFLGSWSVAPGGSGANNNLDGYVRDANWYGAYTNDGFGSNHWTDQANPQNLTAGYQPDGVGRNVSPGTGVNFIVYTGKPTLDTNGDILAECGQGEAITPMTTRMIIEQRLAEADITEEEVKMFKKHLEKIKKTEAK